MTTKRTVVAKLDRDDIAAYDEMMEEIKKYERGHDCGNPDIDNIQCMECSQLFAPLKRALWEGLASKYGFDNSQVLHLDLKTGEVILGEVSEDKKLLKRCPTLAKLAAEGRVAG